MRFHEATDGQSSAECETPIEHDPVYRPLAKSQELDMDGTFVDSGGSYETHPSRNFIGRSLLLDRNKNLTSLASLLRDRNNSTIVKASPTETGDHIPGSDIIWKIPSNFELDAPGPTARTHSLEVETGSELIKKMSASAEMSASYFGFSASAEAQYGMETSVDSSAMYGVYSMNEDNYSVTLKPHADTYEFVDGMVVDAILTLPTWTIDDSAVIKAYKEFFESWGTHYIKKLNYGTRYQLKIDSGSQEKTTQESFKACVKAEYKNVVSIQGRVATEDELKEYTNFRQSECVVRGGDPGAAAILAEDPTNKDKFDAWANSRKTGATDAIMNIQRPRGRDYSAETRPSFYYPKPVILDHESKNKCAITREVVLQNSWKRQYATRTNTFRLGTS
ncbi:hypothetical protein EYZ11_006639 [Aspergillus tanneri]|uniref:MACPF domain-containing protein n=1 Tax=Aspergillus tanneri TaxID=1220188 RepID=A0A4S3JH95_9EURO|nr:hypothetical protein EYZ11_006639 [Aspergillus tanneri]